MNLKPALACATVAVLLAILSSTASADSKCKLVLIDQWPVRLVRNHLIVDGTANGQKIAIMLATGTPTSFMLRSAAERLNLNLQWGKVLPFFGIGGESRVEIANVNDLSFGQFARRGWLLGVPIDQNLGQDIDAVLGDDFFRAVDVEFDLAHEAVRLFRTEDCAGDSLAYWAPEGAGEVAMERVFEARPQIILAVRINGQPILALLDSGATVSILAKRDAVAAGVTPETPGVVAGSKLAGIGESLVDTWIGPFGSFAIGDETIRDVTMRFADVYGNATYTPTGTRVPIQFGQDQPMLLGADFLRAHRVLVAHSQRKLYFTYVGGPVFETTGRAPASSAWLAR